MNEPILLQIGTSGPWVNDQLQAEVKFGDLTEVSFLFGWSVDVQRHFQHNKAISCHVKSNSLLNIY